MLLDLCRALICSVRTNGWRQSKSKPPVGVAKLQARRMAMRWAPWAVRNSGRLASIPGGRGAGHNLVGAGNFRAYRPMVVCRRRRGDTGARRRRGICAHRCTKAAFSRRPLANEEACICNGQMGSRSPGARLRPRAAIQTRTPCQAGRGEGDRQGCRGGRMGKLLQGTSYTDGIVPCRVFAASIFGEGVCWVCRDGGNAETHSCVGACGRSCWYSWDHSDNDRGLRHMEGVDGVAAQAARTMPRLWLPARGGRLTLSGMRRGVRE